MIGEQRIGKEVERSGCGLILGYYPDSCVEGLRKTTKNLSEDSLSPDRNLNQRPSEYETGVLTTRPQCSVYRSLTVYYVATMYLLG
jgi:hypothetical protein